MKIEEQVLSREQMTHLMELGVDTSDASMAWFMSPKTNKWRIKVKNDFLHELLLKLSPERYIPTFTIGDLIEILPKRTGDDWFATWLDIAFDERAVSYCDKEEYEKFRYDYSCDLDKMCLKDALYDALCWVAENHRDLMNKT